MWAGNSLTVPSGSDITFDAAGESAGLGPLGGSAPRILNVTGGSFTTATDMYLAGGSDNVAELNVTAGSVNVGTELHVGRGGTAHVQIDGGYIWAQSLVWERDASGNGSLDVTGSGQLRLDGDVTTQINDLIAAGEPITANGAGAPFVVYNAGMGKTLVLIPEPTTLGLLAIGGLLMLRRRR